MFAEPLDAGGTRHGRRLGARSEHQPTGSDATLSLGLEKSAALTQTQKHRSQLNHALHIIAITRAQRDPATRQHLARKQAEGKTPKGALRSLKRHLARRFYHLLAEPPADQQQGAEPESIAERPPLPAIPERPRPERTIEQTTTAPSPMACISWGVDAPHPSRHSPAAAADGSLIVEDVPCRKIAGHLPQTAVTAAKRPVLSPAAALDEPLATVSTPESDGSPALTTHPSILTTRSETRK